MALALSGNGLLEVLESRSGEIYSLGHVTMLDKSLFCNTSHEWLRSWRRCTEKGLVSEEKSAKQDYMREPSSEILGSCIIELFEW